MELTRTIRVRLEPTPEQASALARTVEANRQALDYVSRVAFERRIRNAIALQRIVYRTIRTRFGLRAQMACTVCRVVAGVYKSMKSNRNEDRPAEFKRAKPVFQWNKDYVLRSGLAHITTLDGRLRIPFRVEPPYRRYLQDGWTFGAAELVQNRHGWYLHVSVSKTMPDPVGDFDAVIGVDQGMRFLVTASCGDHVMFIRGGKVKQTRLHYVRLRASLQRKGTRSAKRRLKAIGRRESRFMTDVNHQIAKAVIRFAQAQGQRPLIVLEDLIGSNLSLRFRMQNQYWRMSWAFRQLSDFIRYKAEEAGIAVMLIDPTGTSETCPKCGHCEAANRSRKRHEFRCKKCGYRCNDDLAASRVIAQKGLECLRQSQSA
ncbi:transposase [Alicyclobacillus mali]|uniref:Transposase n=1 Tax=Alicyclobacillus mali (ex Roth et al. 2021) TaxID=1123961 RepID=A0ABS0EZB9_9BACL|nr:RNA-guided endonuclease TnpB family protein [Alicyclobacillus mali (ex Roth et al. 2021)]MBF8376380.1 transposase [Alicyclobacillus mali (ex Roth et al. 2021)]